MLNYEIAPDISELFGVIGSRNVGENWIHQRLLYFSMKLTRQLIVGKARSFGKVASAGLISVAERFFHSAPWNV